MPLVNYRSEEDIAKEVFEGLSHAAFNTIKSVKIAEDMIQFHHTAGRMIRNDYRLWDRPYTPEIVDGVDVSKNHPDAISYRILMLIWKMVHEAM